MLTFQYFIDISESTSNENLAPPSPGNMLNPNPQVPRADSPIHDDGGGFCSELILWRVDAVGPLSRSGGVGELARINSPHPSAFSNVAWIPTLLPRYKTCNDEINGVFSIKSIGEF